MDAGPREPVSPVFPANREKYRESFDFGGFGGIRNSNTAAFSATSADIPCSLITGNFLSRTGIYYAQNREQQIMELLDRLGSMGPVFSGLESRR